MIYSHIVRPLFFRLPSETAHHLAFDGLRAAMALPGVGALTEQLLAPHDPALRMDVLGQSFDHAVGLAAGFDKDAIGYHALGRLGFGHVEVGTLTARAQRGNDKPRMFRLVSDRALINRMGFNNGGSADAVRRVSVPRRIRLGINIGKSKVTPESEAADDYALSATRLAPYADYMVVNVSSPNTPGLRDLQAVDKLRPILAAVKRAAGDATETPPPLLVKIAPDLADEDVDRVADLALDLGLAGIVATNTTLARSRLRTPGPYETGGLSGAPQKARSLAVLRRLAVRCEGRLTLVAVGGIETADDAWERVRAGASLVQIYTGFIYGGPLTPRRIALGLLERAHRAGFTRVADAVGSGL
ncbi:MAG: quinone-dependent dihydroorotate dehydrogenase [Sandaracinaceae bacterium]